MSSQTILVVGATGMLGTKIAHALLNKYNVRVRVLVRPAHQTQNKLEHIENLRTRGAEIVSGDLLDFESLLKATEGVTGVVSAVQGGDDVIIAGQQNLLRAAEQQGVRRFIPSDYSMNYFALDEGDNANSDTRRQFANILKASSVEHTFVLNGAFTEIELSPWGGLIDPEARTFSYWGDGETPVDMTTIDDVALYTAEAVLDPALANRSLEVAGDVLTLKQFLNDYHEVTGNTLEERRFGSVEELKQVIEQKKQHASSLYEYLPLQYHYAMVSGKGKLQAIENNRYPQIQPLTVKQFLQRAGGK